MAELLAVVASGISVAQLAGQIASSVLKLKSYLDQIKEAPEDIRNLIEEIEVVLLLLTEVEQDQAQQPTLVRRPVPALRCLDNCKKAVESLRSGVDELGADIEGAKFPKKNNRWASVKMVWKRERIEKYRSNLATALSLLNLAYQVHNRYVASVLRSTLPSSYFESVNLTLIPSGQLSYPGPTRYYNVQNRAAHAVGMSKLTK